MSKQSVTETLQQIEFLREIPTKHLEELATVASFSEFDQHKVLFREGDIPRHVCLVETGNVSLEMCAPAIGCKRILTVGAGEILGWSALMEESRMTATARTTEPTRLVEFEGKPLLAMFAKNPTLGYEFSRRTLLALAKRLSATRMQLLDIYGSDLPADAHASEEYDGR